LLPRRLRAAAADPAHDPDRPEYHLLAPHNWMNDPNGPIWWRGQYHLFYQLNPGAAVWGDMHWGHATSPDMVHWRHRPIALAPTPGGPDSAGCFSGSAVVFHGAPTLLYTGIALAPPDQVTIRDGGDKYRETQLLATAADDTLEHWNKLPEPVIAVPPPGMAVTGFRDPCPWREEDGWYLAVGSGERGKGGRALLYRSQDLRHWEYLHPLAEGKPNGLQSPDPNQTGEMWECPDFFAVNGRHCLIHSSEGKVFWETGDYDRATHRFTAARQGLVDHGAFYAPKSFLAPGGRRILWGWIQESRPEAEFSRAGWAGAMSLPRVLAIGAQGQLEVAPARELEQLRGERESIKLTPGAPIRRKLDTLRLELHLPLGLSTGAATVTLRSGGAAAWRLVIDVAGNQIRSGEKSFPLPNLPWPRPSLRLFLDGSVIESFVGGREALTSRVYGLRSGETELEVAIAGKAGSELELWPLAAISTNRLTGA
ncbi:MAG: glycoside hydrolase family 32 protein, partial [Terracidiphilus sp.]